MRPAGRRRRPRQVDPVLDGLHDGWAEQRRCLGLDALQTARGVLADREATPAGEVTTDLIAGALDA